MNFVNRVPDFPDVEAMDDADPLRAMRDRFALPSGIIYLDGNSLGAAPVAALAQVEIAAREEWASNLIRSWNTAGWFDLPTDLGDRIGRLVGAQAGQIVVCDNTSINIFKALNAALSMRPDRSTIVSEASSFPTDLYIAEGVASVRNGVELRLAGIDGDSIEDLLNEQTAVVLVNHVDYKTGRLRDMSAVTRAAHAVGAMVLWDLCHTAGALPIELDACSADLAVGCTYKYLNGGPGSPAYIYVAHRHLDDARQPLSGWWGHKAPFAFDHRYRADSGIRQFLSGTQPILSFRALKSALDVWDDVDMQTLRDKSIALTELFIQLVEARCGAYGLQLASPRDSAARGSQVSFDHPNSYPIMQALIDRGVIGDFRAPQSMRFGFAPLYVGFRDVWNAVDVLEDVLKTEAWKEARFASRSAVT